jgi:hypothetical protein
VASARILRAVIRPGIVLRARHGCGSSVISRPDQWQALQPLVSIISADERTFPAFSGPQSTLSDFGVSSGPAYFVALAKSIDAHRPLHRPALSFSL